MINDDGQTAFRANLAGNGINSTNNQGIWSEGSGSLALVARTGSAAPACPTACNFAINPALELFEPVINSAGTDRILWRSLRWHRGPLVRRFRQSNVWWLAIGMHATGTPDGVNHSFEVLRDFYTDLPMLNDAGQTAFYANIVGRWR